VSETLNGEYLKSLLYHHAEWRMAKRACCNTMVMMLIFLHNVFVGEEKKDYAFSSESVALECLDFEVARK